MHAPIAHRHTSGSDHAAGNSRAPLLRCRHSRILGLVALLCGLCNPAAAQQVSVQLNWKHQFEFAAFYAALEHGEYQAAGLDVSIREGGPGIDVVSEVVQGRADFGVGGSALVVERYRGQPVVALASLMQHSPVALLALRRFGINSVHDLAGRPVAVDPHDRDEIDAYLRAAGLPAAQIRLVDQTDWSLESLETGRVAAKTAYISNETFLTRGREHEFTLLRPQSAGIDLFGNILFTTQGLAGARPDTVKAFRDATMKGLVYALEHPQELADLILARYNTQGKTREHLLFEAEQLHALTRADIVEPGYMSPGRWRHVVGVYAAEGKMPADFDLRGFLFASAPEAIPAWLIGSLAGASALLVAACALALKWRALNGRLAGEVIERREAERKLGERERFLSTVVDTEPECVKLLDRDGRILHINRAGLHMIEADSEAEVAGLAAADLVLPAHQSAFIDQHRRVLAGETAALEFEIEGLRGGRRWLETYAAPLRDAHGEVVANLSVTRDITERKRTEAELAHYREQLEERVAERTADLVTARDEATRLARVKSEFLANMSHEIRTPLNAILGFARIGARESTGRTCLETFGRIQDAGEHLLGVVNDVLDYAKIEAGKLGAELRPFQLAAALANAGSLVAETAHQKGLRLVTQPPADLPEWVLGDAQRLRQILVNLLSNAVKFTPTGEVRLSISRDGEDVYRFHVADTGIGISAEQRARLFQPFEQADTSTTRQFGGTGLGLAISRELARLMGGDITVDSTPGVGSIFTLHLPLPTTQPALPARVERTARQRLPHLRVLAAEDMEVNRLILEDLLVHEGAQVVFADDGQGALDRLEQAGVSAFDVVLMDLQMPVMDGIEATGRIGAIAPGLPVIGLTAHALPDAIERCRAAGMVDVVTKPIDPDTLIPAIDRHTRMPDGHRPRPAPPLIRWPALQSRYQGRQAFINRLLTKVLDSHGGTPARLRTAVAERDAATVTYLAHTLKGLSGNLDAPQMRQLAAHVESELGRTPPPGSTIPAAKALALADQLDALLLEVQAHLHATGDAPRRASA